ncbi:MAG: BACON domain-containing protein [Alistipes sp.]|nr:BACON domain-containing protein [Alistipes sp.]
MKKIFSILFLASLIMVACEEPAEQPNASVTVTPESVEFTADGGVAEVSFNTEGGAGSKVSVKEDASWLDAKVNGSVINLTATANTTANVREVVVTVKYESAEATFTVKQAGSEYDVVFNAKRFEGIYFGTEYSAMHNYYIILSDVGVKTDASAKANGKYYYFDMYRNIKADEMNPVLPDGEYKFDTTNSYADKTFSDDGSWYAVTGADGKVTESASFKEATVTVKNGKFSAIIVMEDDTTHYVSYEGDLVATTHITTLSGDVEFNIEGAEITATNYGDTLEVGQQNWFVEARKGDDLFFFEVFTANSASCDGIYQVLPTDSKDYNNRFIPGLIGSDGLVGSWYAKLTDDTIKGDVMAPMSSGMIRITTEGNAMTIELGCKDDAGNNITGSIKGNIK